MQPIGPLMHEHRLIERLLHLVERETAGIEAGREADRRFIDQAVDFFRTYADRCHHGKEEDILFRELAKKPLSADEARVLAELVEEHVQGRALVKAIAETNRAGSPAELLPLLKRLAAFYPVHIAKEDKAFFFPVMRHFSRAEMDAMLAEFDDFDRRLVHEKYAALVAEREAALGG
jgi:hemerythrin-like domain-containing protein